MIESEYETFCSVGITVKYNIEYDRCLIGNIVCANYVYDILKQGYHTLLTTEQLDILLDMIQNILGHRIYYLNQDYHTKTCYFDIVDDDFEVTEDNIKALTQYQQRNRVVDRNVTTNNQKVIYAYPKYFGPLRSIKNPDLRLFQLLSNFTQSEITIDGIPCYVYLLTKSSSVDDYEMIFI